MAPFSFHIFVVNIEGKGVMFIFRLQVFICKPSKKLNLLTLKHLSENYPPKSFQVDQES